MLGVEREEKRRGWGGLTRSKGRAHDEEHPHSNPLQGGWEQAMSSEHWVHQLILQRDEQEDEHRIEHGEPGCRQLQRVQSTALAALQQLPKPPPHDLQDASTRENDCVLSWGKGWNLTVLALMALVTPISAGCNQSGTSSSCSVSATCGSCRKESSPPDLLPCDG